MSKKPELKPLQCPDGSITTDDASVGSFHCFDKSCAFHSERQKIAFAISAINRWSGFVESVQKVEAFICLYEQRSELPELGGDPRE